MEVSFLGLSCQWLFCSSAVNPRGGYCSNTESDFLSKCICSICSQLALQASQLKGQEAREALSNTFTAIAEMDQSLKQMEQMFAALNSFTEDLSNNLDYDRRLEAYHNLSTEAWKGFPKPVALPLIHTCLYDIANPDDISLRQAASEALSR